MLLYEFDSSPLLVKLVAVTNQLKNDIDTGEVKPNWTVEEFLSYLQKYDIVLDKQDLYDMIQNPPLNSVISNIQGDNVIFKGQNSPDGQDDVDGENEKVVKQMATKAMK